MKPTNVLFLFSDEQDGNANVNLVDAAPTIVQAMGRDRTRDLPGQSLISIASRPDDPDRIAFSEYHAVGCPSAAYRLRQGRFAYHPYVGFRPELFDVDTDPNQHHDLVGTPEHETVIDRVEKLLRKRLDPDCVDRRAKADQVGSSAIRRPGSGTWHRTERRFARTRRVGSVRRQLPCRGIGSISRIRGKAR